MGSPYKNFEISKITGSILLTFAEYVGLGMVFLSDRVSWLWRIIWWRQTAGKIYIFVYLKIGIFNNFEDIISDNSYE